MSDNRIIAKIRAMLAKASEGSGATEDEAATALSMAMAMMAKYGIERSQLEGDDNDEKPEEGRWSDDQFLKWHIYTAQAASYLYHCKVVQLTGGKKRAIRFVGKPSYIQACEMTFEWINQQVERLYKEALPPGLDKATRAELRRTFKMACALRVRSRAWSIMQAMANDDALALEMTGSTALVVKSHMEKEKEQLESFYKELDYRPAIQRSSKAGIGTGLGFRAGDRVQLQKQVSEKRLMIGKD